jgi:uncharacterized protein
MTMTIGVARVTLHFDDNESLKEKRQVIRSITARVRDKFNVSIAEVEDLDDMRLGTLGVTCVSNSAPHVDEMLATVISFIERNVEYGVLGEIETEHIPYS